MARRRKVTGVVPKNLAEDALNEIIKLVRKIQRRQKKVFKSKIELDH